MSHSRADPDEDGDKWHTDDEIYFDENFVLWGKGNIIADIVYGKIHWLFSQKQNENQQ